MSAIDYLLSSKNKVEISSLKKKLKLLDSVKKADLRLQNNTKCRFRTKYGLSQDYVHQTSDGHVYDSMTHTCCFSQLSADVLNNRSDYQGMLELLFTDGELDTNKVLCLHALSSHPCETLKHPNKFKLSNFRLTSNSRPQNTLDLLFERSGAKNAGSMLPRYVLNLNSRIKNKSSTGYSHERFIDECFIRDGRLAARLVINENITRLVNTVLEALQCTNPLKMSYLMRQASNPNQVKEIICLPEMEDFLKSITNHRMIIGSNSFYLTRPFERCIHITLDKKTPIVLEKLIHKIRNNVLTDSVSNHQEKVPKKVSNTELTETNLPSKVDDANKQNVKVPENEMYDLLVLGKSPLYSRKFDAEKVATLLTNKIHSAYKRDMIKFKRSQKRLEKKSVNPLNRYQNIRLSSSLSTDTFEFSIVEDEKAAPVENSNKKLSKAKPLIDLSKSTEWLESLIEEEEQHLRTMKKLKKQETRERNKITTNNDSSYKKRMFGKENFKFNSGYLQKAKNFAQFYGYKIDGPLNVVNNLNLAKIKLEISIKENDKRVKKFLEEPLYDKNKN